MKKHSVKIKGHATSISLEEEFWAALKQLSSSQNCSLNTLISRIDLSRKNKNLSSTLRIYVLRQLQKQLSHS